MRKRLVCALLVLILLLPVCGFPAHAGIRAPKETAAPTLPPIMAKEQPGDSRPLEVFLDGLLFARGYEWGGDAFIPLRPFCEYAGIDMTWDGDWEQFNLRLDNLNVEGQSGQQYYIADGRYIYAPEDWFIFNWDLYLPLNAFCKLLNLTEERDGDIIRLDGGKMRLLEGGKDYYDLNFPTEDVYWLSHIIGSEAGIEPLEGKIAVGNVVLNRVADPEFPNTVFEVVYDYEHTVQFEPVSKGTIHQEPKADDLIAAYLVLEGANTAGDCIYFVNPDFGSFWFDNNLDLVVQIGRHNFYVSRVPDNAGTTTGTDSASGS